MRIRHLVLLLALFAASPLAAQSTQEFRSATAGFTVQVPVQWRRLTATEMRPIQQSMAQQGAGASVEAVYRLTDSPAGLPYVVMTTIDVGEQITREDLRAMTGAQGQAMLQKGADDIAAGAARMGVPLWDEESGTVWTRAVIDVGGQTAPFMWTVYALHPGGRTVVVFAYYAAPGDDEARVRADLRAIVGSLRAG